MTIDRWTKTMLTVIAIALVALTAHAWRVDVAVVDAIRPASASGETATPKYDVAIPKSWGKYIAFSNNNLLLEAPDGTMRIVDVEGKAPEYPRVKMQIRWQ